MPLHAQAPRLLSASSLHRRPRFRSSSSAAINHSVARPTSPTRRNSFSASPRGRSNAGPPPTVVDAGGGQLVALPWAGTFHSIGARLLREYAERVSLPANFTIHDRGDSEDLMAVVRQDLKIAVTKKRFPGSATCVAIYSRIVNAESPLADVLRDNYPWCATWESGLNGLFGAYVAA